MSERTCWRCSKSLPPGCRNYVIHVEVSAGFDGVLKEPEEGLDASLSRLLDQVDRSDPKELEKDIHEEFTFLLCKRCRDRLVHEIKYPWEGPFQTQKDPDSTFH